MIEKHGFPQNHEKRILKHSKFDKMLLSHSFSELLLAPALKHPVTYMRKVVIMHRSTLLCKTQRKLVGRTDEKMIADCSPDLLLILVSIVATLPASVLEKKLNKNNVQKRAC